MIQILRLLSMLEETLNTATFSVVWKELAQRLEELLLDDVVLSRQFSFSGGCQFRHDVSTLVALFKKYTTRPEHYFKRYRSVNSDVVSPNNAYIQTERSCASVKPSDKLHRTLRTRYHRFSVAKLAK